MGYGKTKSNPKTMDAVLQECNYPSNLDNMVRNDTPFEGTANALPVMNPVYGASKLGTKKIKKTSAE